MRVDRGLGDQMDTMVETWSALASQVAPMLPVVEAYVAKHPEQRVAIRRDGLQTLIDGGEVVPFKPEELQALLVNTASSEGETRPTEQD